MKQFQLGALFAVLSVFSLADRHNAADVSGSDSYERAINYVKNGERSLAEEAFIRASMDPKIAPDAYFQLARLSINSSDWQTAENWIRRSLEARPDSEEGLYLLGYVLFRQGTYQSAARSLLELLEKNPRHVEGHKILGLVYFQLERMDEAQRELRSAIRLNPGLAEGHYLLGRLLYDQNHFDEAKLCFQTAIQLEPQFMKAHDNLGLTLDALGEGQKAIDSFRQALDLNERLKIGSKWPYLNLGEALLKQEQYSQSIQYFRKALALDPSWAKAHVCLGKALVREGKDDEAKANFLAAIRLDPSSRDAHYQLGQLYRRQGDLVAAQKELSVFQQLQEKSPAPTLSAP